MKRVIAIVFVMAAMGAGAFINTHSDDIERIANRSGATALRLWDGIEANPAPVIVALGTFFLTVLYHKLGSKPLREATDVVAARVLVARTAGSRPEDLETAVLTRAKARAMRSQLLADQISLENRSRKLPDAVKVAEQDVASAEQALSDARQTVVTRLRAHEEAAARLAALRKEQADGEVEMAAIARGLKTLTDSV